LILISAGKLEEMAKFFKGYELFWGSITCRTCLLVELDILAKGYELSVEVCLFETIIITVEISHTIEVN
jgi:hypothetical protein